MSLRDWFAGQALAEAVRVYGWPHEGEEEHYAAKAARLSYFYADAMLSARKKDAPNG